MLADNVKTRVLQASGAYERLVPPAGTPPLRSQQVFWDRAGSRTGPGQSAEPPQLRLRATVRLRPATRREALRREAQAAGDPHTDESDES
jgi:hypothetical protein